MCDEVPKVQVENKQLAVLVDWHEGKAALQSWLWDLSPILVRAEGRTVVWQVILQCQIG